MKTETDKLRDELRALRESQAIGLPDYGADPIVTRRLGAMIVKAMTKKP